MFTNVEFDIGHCDKCDISISCHFKPGRGRGIGHSLCYIIPNTSKTDYNKTYCNGRKNKLIRDFNDEYNFNAYYTGLVKCVSISNPSVFEITNCFGHLRKELFLVQPKVIILVGDVVANNFINYKYFNEVVDKPKVLNLNGSDVILYPIYHPSYDTSDNMKILYDKSFNTIARLYKQFINPNYLLF